MILFLPAAICLACALGAAAHIAPSPHTAPLNQRQQHIQTDHPTSQMPSAMHIPGRRSLRYRGVMGSKMDSSHTMTAIGHTIAVCVFSLIGSIGLCFGGRVLYDHCKNRRAPIAPMSDQQVEMLRPKPSLHRREEVHPYPLEQEGESAAEEGNVVEPMDQSVSGSGVDGYTYLPIAESGAGTIIIAQPQSSSGIVDRTTDLESSISTIAAEEE